MVLAAASSEGVIYEHASGVRSFGADTVTDAGVSMDSVFWLASCTKLVTS